MTKWKNKLTYHIHKDTLLICLLNLSDFCLTTWNLKVSVDLLGWLLCTLVNVYLQQNSATRDKTSIPACILFLTNKALPLLTPQPHKSH